MINFETFKAALYIHQNLVRGAFKLKSADTWEKFPSGDDTPAPYPTWDFFLTR